MTTQDDAEQRLSAALTDVHQAYKRAAEALGQIPDPHRAFHVATALATALRELADDAADQRALTVERIWHHEATSLAGLAQRIGVSKARAGQFMKSARNVRDRQTRETPCADK